MAPAYSDDEYDESSSVGDEREDAINEIVADVVDEFLREFSRHLGISQPESSPHTPLSEVHVPAIKVPETEEDYRRYVWRFIENNLKSYYQPGDPYVEELVKIAATRAKDLTQKYELEPEVTPRLAIMALYDFVILCDDSSSMRKDRRIRIQALEDTCERVAEFGSSIQPHGVYLRFLNNSQDQHYNELTDKEVKVKMKDIKYSGSTRLGTVLGSKIVNPLIIDKVQSGQLEKPVITVIITDGDPQGEAPTCLEKTVLDCKRRLSELSKEPEGAVFLISRVGNDPNAVAFLSSLRMNKDLQETLYCCPDQLDDRREVFRKAGNSRLYSSYLIKLFEAALESQTDI
ncbi:vWA domain-containing protein [Aspergillus ibericus CBS 121593]|uniref:VWFA domain-containing protein n=1 Tax=Aspergillus ibericus CBS 121593 TaxID=1448316 RepID=A0A395H9B0_9EURO|nr:hypothetical protein BO80DRAFT_399897 [Aspergillus ibericus CBS 121593]RAL04442.1 hypothetical protein BO80DRAFT_399897 [Aspergillus ibericus CBS 121593]